MWLIRWSAAALLLLSLTGPTRADELAGKIAKLDFEAMRLVLTDADGKDWAFAIDPKVAVVRFQEPMDFHELVEMIPVTVTYEKRGDRLVVIRIQCNVFFRRLPERALVQVFYATDRRHQDEPPDYSLGWYVGQFYPAALAAAATAALGLLYQLRRRRWQQWLAAAGAAAAIGLASYGAWSCAVQSSRPVKGELVYSNDRGHRLHLGACQVSIPADHRIGEIESPSILKFEYRYDPRKHLILQSIEPKEDSAFYQQLREAVARSQKQQAFVFIHGYNVSFEGAALRTAQLAYDLEFDGAAIFYSWPSQGGLLQYTVDESNVEWTVHDLKGFLGGLAARSGARQIHLIAHSMGNRALTNALRELAAEGDADLSAFQEVVLAAPDIDAEVFERSIAPAIRQAARRCTLYASSRDQALVLSKQVHGYRRAGDAGDGIVVIPGVDTIDVSAVDTSLLGHSYYGDNVSLIADLFHLLKLGLPPPQRERLMPRQRAGLPYWEFRPEAKEDAADKW